MHTATETHAATKVAQQMAKQIKIKIRWAQTTGYEQSPKGAKGNTDIQNDTLVTNHYKHYDVLVMNFPNLWWQSIEVYFAWKQVWKQSWVVKAKMKNKNDTRVHLWYHLLLNRATLQRKQNQYNTIKRKIVRKEKVGCGTGIHWLFYVSLLPQKFCPWWAQLQNAANQTLALIQRGRGSREVELTVIQ